MTIKRLEYNRSFYLTIIKQIIKYRIILEVTTIVQLTDEKSFKYGLIEGDT